MRILYMLFIILIMNILIVVINLINSEHKIGLHPIYKPKETSCFATGPVRNLMYIRSGRIEKHTICDSCCESCIACHLNILNTQNKTVP